MYSYISAKVVNSSVFAICRAPLYSVMLNFAVDSIDFGLQDSFAVYFSICLQNLRVKI